MDIRPYAKNAKVHTEKQLEALARVVARVGWRQNVEVNQKGVIVAGHGRYLAWEKYKSKYSLPDVWITDDKGKTIFGKHATKPLTDEEEAMWRLADNQLNAMTGFDMELVVEELKGLSQEMLELTGFDADLILEVDDKDDEVPATPKKAQTKLGDLYELGEHRILCGDATKIDDVNKLMGGVKADMVFTDPPYNVDYSGSGKKTRDGILNDKMSDDAFLAFLVDAFGCMAEVTKRTAGCYVFHSHKTASTFEEALTEAGFTIDTQLIWNKPSAGMGMNDYRTKHEPFFYCSQGTEKDFYGDRTGTTVWKIPRDDAKAFKWFLKHYESQEKGETTIWTMSRANVNEYVHPTQKPVELPVTAMTKSSKVEDIILDPFLGSGTTLIAAQKAGRVCYGMELDPKYVDVIVQRWVDYTGTRKITKNGKQIVWQKS